MQRLQKTFPADLQVVLVNSNETNNEAGIRLKKLNERRSASGLEPFTIPDLQQINGDTVLSKIFPAQSIPHHVWIDDKGIIQAITYSKYATADNISKFLSGKLPRLELKDEMAAGSIKKNGFLQSPYSKIIPGYYSVVFPYFKGLGGGSVKVDTVNGIFYKALYNLGVENLYRQTLGYNQNTKFLVNELREKEKYFPSKKEGEDISEWNGKYLFSYESQVDLKDKNTWHQKMLHDLNFFFGSRFGIEGICEQRLYNSLVLIKTDERLLPLSHNGEAVYKKSDSCFKLKNYSFNYFFSRLSEIVTVKGKTPVFFNETGIDSNLKIDIQFTGNLSDINNVRKQLHKYGLDLIEAERKVEVLIIKEKE